MTAVASSIPAPPSTTTTTTSEGPVPQAGCPPPPHPPRPPVTPWHPAVLVPDAKLPTPTAPAPWVSDVEPITGKGMWVWQWTSTEHGKPDAIVARATAAGLHQLWVRVGDSPDGFYGRAELDALVPKAHAAGLTVIGWGFPYLYDPVRDAAWTAQVLAWRSSGGEQVDGYSADLERATEGVAMSGLRAGVYLDLVRRAAGDRLVVATVYPPLDDYWAGDYPYRTMATYVDAFAPMEYWECVDPGADAVQALARLGALRPVHLIGQAFSMADSDGRAPYPSADEIGRFLSVGREAGAIGVSFWVWQTAVDDEWRAITAYRWSVGQVATS
ncbi:MAG: hypothetical protein ACYDH6_21915 [Acidimicrobiales bacterium]